MNIAFNMDCMEAMKKMKDKEFDIAIVDPPYRDENENQPTKDMRNNQFIKTFGNKPTEEYFKELRRVSKNQVIWGGNNFQLPPFKGFIVWDKGIAEKFTMSMAEIAAISEGLGTVSKIFRCRPQGAQMGESERIHPTQKPVALYKWILKTYAKKGDSILDTHLGSGSSRIAAYDMGFDFVGYEINKIYFDLEEERFRRHTNQINMFIDYNV